MWDRFYGDIDHDGRWKRIVLKKAGRSRLVTDVAGVKVPAIHTSTAAIQGLFLFNKDDMAGAIGMAEGLIPRIYEPEMQAGIKVPA